MRVQAIINIYPAVTSINGGVTVTDINDNAVTLDEALITAETQRLQDIHDSQEYARNRKTEYDQLNQWELQFDDQRDGTSTWVDAINAIKNRNPK